MVNQSHMFSNKLWSVCRCEVQVQTDNDEGRLEQGQGSDAQAGLVAKLQERVGKLKAGLALERAATMAADSRCAELRAAVNSERRTSFMVCC